VLRFSVLWLLQFQYLLSTFEDANLPFTAKYDQVWQKNGKLHLWLVSVGANSLTKLLRILLCFYQVAADSAENFSKATRTISAGLNWIVFVAPFSRFKRITRSENTQKSSLFRYSRHINYPIRRMPEFLKRIYGGKPFWPSLLQKLSKL
jgi:hypothetical protein